MTWKSLALVWVLAIGTSGCRAKDDFDRRTHPAYVREPEITPVAWLGSDSGIVYQRIDILGKRLGDVLEPVCDSSGIYVSKGRTAGQPLHRGAIVCDILQQSHAVSLDIARRVIIFPDGNSSGAVYLLDLNRRQKKLLTPQCTSNSGRAVWSPDTRYIAFTAKCNSKSLAHILYRMKENGDSILPIGIPLDSVEERDPSWSPDAEYLAITRGSQLWKDSVVVVNVRTGSRKAIAKGYGAAWSPMGQWIAYLRLDSAQGVTPTIRVIRADGTEDQEILRAEAIPDADKATAGWMLGPLLWSPDEKQIAFSLGSSLWTVDAVTRQVSMVFRLPAWHRK